MFDIIHVSAPWLTAWGAFFALLGTMKLFAKIFGIPAVDKAIKF